MSIHDVWSLPAEIEVQEKELEKSVFYIYATFFSTNESRSVLGVVIMTYIQFESLHDFRPKFSNNEQQVLIMPE